jgi:hypothetical protein
MRIEACARAPRLLSLLLPGLAAALLGAAHAARALPAAASAPAPLTLRIEAADPLPVGTAAQVDVFVRVAAGDEQPLLLTPISEGDAVRVVRGRLSHADAQRTEGGELRFEVPVVVRSAGAAVLRVDVLTYRCAERERCEELRASATRVLHAAAR